MMLDQTTSPAEEPISFPCAVAADPGIDRSEIHGFFEMLKNLAAPLRNRGNLVICGFGEDTGESVQDIRNKPRKLRPEIRHVHTDEIDRAVDHVTYLATRERYNVYVALAIYSDDLPFGARGHTKHILALLGLVADFDDADASHWAERLPLPPQLVLETSAGRFQAFYLFNEPHPPDVVAPIARCLKEFVGCDHGTADINHVWRIPGTLNRPNAKKIAEGRSPQPQLVRVVLPWNGTTMQLADLAAALCPPAAPQTQPPPAGGPLSLTCPPPETIADIIDTLPRSLRDRLSDPTGDRSKALFGIVCELRKLGHEQPTIVAVLAHFPEGPASKHATREALDRDIARILAKNANGGLDGADNELEGNIGEGDVDSDTAESESPKALPGLHIDDAHLPASAERLRDIFATSGRLFDRGGPAKIVREPNSDAVVANRLGVDSIVFEAHKVCRPYEIKVKSTRKGTTTASHDITLPDRVARLYLSMVGEYKLPVLNGITSAPVLFEDGTVHLDAGYEPRTGLWCEGLPGVAPDAPYALCHPTPTMRDAASALRRIRQSFMTFPFADSPRISVSDLKGSERIGIIGDIGGLFSGSLANDLPSIEVVDIDQPPGLDESAFLCSLLTAVCRPSLPLAPGTIIRAPQTSGSGAGKGLLVRAISLIAFGRLPAATPSAEKDELEKRIASTLISGSPVVFLDNVNSTALRSNTLASAITERPARIRVFGKLELVEINPSAFVAVTGNGLSVSEDLARRFIVCGLDPKMEDPEKRPFSAGFLDGIRSQRIQLLRDLLTVWRYGRQSPSVLVRGRPFGSFEVWAEWVRDPLLTLECADPVNRIDEIKASDPRRRKEAEILTTWFELHGDRPMKAADINESVRMLIDPQGRGRQFIVSALERMVGTRISGLMLTTQRGAGKWSVATYAVSRTDNSASLSLSPLPCAKPLGNETEQAVSAFDPEAILNAEIGP